MTAAGHTGVVLMAYGTPRRRDDVLAYYTDSRRGRPPTDEQLADLLRRYEAIGGLSPLTERTESQRRALQRSLDRLAPGAFRVVLGFKHTSPSVEDGVAEAVAAGAGRIVGLVLAPHYSQASVGQYLQRLEAAAPAGRAVATIRSWATAAPFVATIAADLSTRLARMPPGTRVVFTAHSLPQRVIDAGDPYADELRSTAQAVAVAAGLGDDRWQIAWQSAGRTPEPWIGPDILEVIDALAAEGAPGVLVAAVGFVADHLEVLYDLDVEAAGRAATHGLAFDRAACVNDDQAVADGLAALVLAADPR